MGHPDFMASAQQLVPMEEHTVADVPFSPSKRQYVRYLLWTMVVPAILWVAAFPLVCSRSYEDWGETQWGPVLEFPYEAGTPDADVVVWGDSSAFIGIDPRLVNRQLGIASVVLPSTVGSLPVIGDEPLRAYLAHHRKPRLIVLYFSPWNLDFSHMAPGRLFEGEEIMLRHGSRGEILRYELQHPLELLAFPVRLYSTFGSKLILEALHHKSRAREAFASLGHAPYLEPFGPLEDLCRLPATYLNQTSSRTVEDLQRTYRANGMQVMVYLAPIPNCNNSGALRQRGVPALGAEPPRLLPPTEFAADRYYAHIRPPRVPVASAIFADALRARLEQVAPELLAKAGAAAAQAR